MVPSPRDTDPIIAADFLGGGAPEETASLNSLSEDDAGVLEIKQRGPGVGGSRCDGIMKGRVRKVVDAFFESGLNITTKGISPAGVKTGGHSSGEGGTSSSTLDEYGSNLLDPVIGKRKRPLVEVEGGLEESPTPKKQFVEEKEMNELVEEASREWPHPDK
ncbi:unnamed protein product [Linum trigynum]|uniref:Uncharacterized protein n=1 Tax=Linum trigynum TaxID=586398 RepID=A0AAV2CC61_9ROSI